jgi:hypothetical protein
MMCRRVSVIAMLFLLFPLAVWGQREGRHGTTAGTSGAPTTPPEDPDMTTFNHAVAVLGTAQQITQFRLMIKSTESARQQAADLQHMSAEATDSEGLFSKANALQDSVEEAQNENRRFRRSLSDSQEAGLKNLTKKLSKSNAAVSKDAKAISQQLEWKLDPTRLANAAAHLSKALSAFQADQVNLGKEMGIPSR